MKPLIAGCFKYLLWLQKTLLPDLNSCYFVTKEHILSAERGFSLIKTITLCVMFKYPLGQRKKVQLIQELKSSSTSWGRPSAA